MDFTDTDVQTLANKIEGLDLSPQEHAALSAVLDVAEAAGDDDVAGFGGGLPIGFRMGKVLGVPRPAGADADGIAAGPPESHLEIDNTSTYGGVTKQA